MLMEHLGTTGFARDTKLTGWCVVPQHLYADLPGRLRQRFFRTEEERLLVNPSALMKAAYEVAPGATRDTYWESCLCYGWSKNDGGLDMVSVEFPFQDDFDAAAAAGPSEYPEDE
jgi:hypothetical protein